MNPDPLVNGSYIQQHLKARFVVIPKKTQDVEQFIPANPQCGHAFRSMLAHKGRFTEFTIQFVYNCG
jgi:hypothetical protein